MRLRSLYFVKYEQDYYLFEVAVIFKKMLLTGALTVVAPGSTVQVVIGIIIVLFNLLYVLKTGPFADPSDDFLAFSTSLQMIFTLLVAILLMTNKDTTQYDPNFADVVLVMVNSFSMLALMFSIIAMHDWRIQFRELICDIIYFFMNDWFPIL